MLPRPRALSAVVLAAIAALLAAGGYGIAYIIQNPNPCDRTQEMRDALERATERKCDLITGDDLADIDHLVIQFEDEMPVLKRRDFAGMRHLEGLSYHWYWGFLGAIPGDVFSGLPKDLQSLDLSYSGLSELPPGAFDGLANLQSLDLSGNDLTELPPGVFDGLANLQSLDLRYNPGDPFDIDIGICNRVPVVRTALELASGRNCAVITIADISDVQSLDLSDNGLAELSPGVFNGLTNLQSLNLSNVDSITLQPGALQPGVFNGLTNLQELDLQYNDLTKLPPGVFDGLANLRSLDLQYNDLTKLPPGVFDGLANLRSLDLGSNRFTELPPGVFDGLVNLQSLDLRYNGGF